MEDKYKLELSRKLLRYGILLFLLGLITGFAIPAMQNPRMGLSSHLEGVMNGMLLILFGLLWPKLNLPERYLKWGFGLSLFGTYTNWATTLFAGFLGAGAEMMPIAGGGLTGEPWQEIIIKFGLISLSLSMLAVCGLLLWGLRGSNTENE
ncbi:MAG: hydrogenase [Ignavibacteriae bacterium]|nr:hydrogenase [Ignavibacteriota bacterium]